MANLADTIADDLRECAPFRRLELEVGTDLARAYDLQDAVIERLLANRPGRKMAGYKLGFNKQSSYDYYGITEPCAAPVLSDRVVDGGAVLVFSDYRDLVIEPEIVAYIAADLPDTGTVTPMQARAAIREFGAAFELLDPRGAFALDPSAAEAVAQGIHNVGAVLGATRLPSDAVDLSRLPVRLTVGSAVIGEATGAAPQSPDEAVAWLANHLARRGRRLEAGMVVLCGTHLPAQPITGPRRVRLDMGQLGAVDFELAG